MGALMQSHDWSLSPLGPPAYWPDTLKASVATCLASRFPMVIWWGPDLIMLYNDAWQPILGETKHPAGLGRPGAASWPETWPIVGQQFQDALNGNASCSANGDTSIVIQSRGSLCNALTLKPNRHRAARPIGHMVRRKRDQAIAAALMLVMTWL